MDDDLRRKERRLQRRLLVKLSLLSREMEKYNIADT